MNGKYIRILLGIAFAFFCATAHAGTCPSGANYLSLSNPTGPLVTLSSLGVTNCFFIAANGSDSNDGASEASGHPWLHAPGMPNCAANCKSNSPAGGDGYIFRGGDTWHFGNSSLSPYAGGQTLNWHWGGSSGAYVYVGVDAGWFSGSSWARPIFTGDNPLSTSQVSSCSFGFSGDQMVNVNGIRYFILDNLEMTGLCAICKTEDCTAYVTVNGSVSGANNPGAIENLYIHGLTYSSASFQDAVDGIHESDLQYGYTMQFNAMDGSDSDYHALSCWGQQTAGYQLQYNVCRYAGGTNVPDDCHWDHDNLFEYISNVTDGSSHTDALFCYAEYSGGTGNPNIFYNNIFRNIGTLDGTTLSYNFTLDTPAGQTDYVFNSVFHDLCGLYNTVPGCGSGTVSYNYNAMCDPGSGCGPTVMWNNTAEGALPSYGFIWGNQNAKVAITSVNDHWIVAGTGPSASFSGPNYVTETVPVYQTISAANGQGYNSSNDFSPTASSNATVAASGTNETAGYCADSVLHNAAAEAACTMGITGVSYNATNHTVVYPAYAPVSRPSSGSWNVGAFQFGSGSGSAPLPPTNVTVTVQ